MREVELAQTVTTQVSPVRPAAAEAPHRLWGGRFAAGPAPALDELNRSLPIDKRLWREDIEASRAWVQALGRANVLSAAEARELDRGLRAVADRFIETPALLEGDDEDIHTLVERVLYEEVGAVAGKLHTGRSRNDQVATDARLWAMRALRAIEAELKALQAALVQQAGASIDVLMPSYTHLRRAQPIRAAQWLLAHFWALERDRERLLSAIDRVAVLPLGSGAIAGCAFAIDRTLLKELLGFRAISDNSLDAVGDRDWICETIFVCAMIGTHLSRLAEDMILFSTQEFDFIELPEAYTTGSSLMPQKRNPDGLELARGMAGRLLGDLTASLAMLKGVPSGYNKDLQEDKRTLFSTIDGLAALLPATRETIAGMHFKPEPLAAAVADETLIATDLADELVRRGVPFREAHGAVGRLLRAADERGIAVSGLADAEWADAHPAFLAGGRPKTDALASVEARAVPGGTSRSAVQAQLTRAQRLLS